MHVSEAELAAEARRAGFCSGTVDSQMVVLARPGVADKVEWLAFGRPSAKWLEGIARLGFAVEPTGTEDVLRMTWQGPSANIDGKPACS